MPNFDIDLSDTARFQLEELMTNPSKKSIAKAVLKSLKYMRANIRHPSLNTHKFNGFSGPNKEDVFETYAQNNTPGAYRIFWFYGPKKSVITIFSIMPHP